MFICTLAGFEEIAANVQFITYMLAGIHLHGCLFLVWIDHAPTMSHRYGKQKGEIVRRKRPVMQTILIVTLLSLLQKKVVRLRLKKKVQNQTRNLLLTQIGGLTKKWCAIMHQMRKISKEGIRKFVTQAQNIQIFCED